MCKKARSNEPLVSPATKGQISAAVTLQNCQFENFVFQWVRVANANSASLKFAEAFPGMDGNANS